MIYLFGIPNCDTVKKSRNFLEAQKISFTFVDFKKSPPTSEQIELWRVAFGDLPVNKKGQTYKKFASEYESLSDAEKVTFLTQHSSMLKRPILQRDSTVLAFGHDEEAFRLKLGI
jgi:Spx/MgsR family transcriptional regulator